MPAPATTSSTRAAGLSLALATVLLAACGPEAAPPPKPGPVPVTVVTLDTESLTLTRELPGRTRAFLIAEVRPQVNGIVERRLFTEGSLVKAGQPLYQLDDDVYRADVASAKATRARAQAAVNSARLTAKRSAELARIDAVSKQDNENAIAALRLAEADVAAAQAALERTEVTLSHARITSPISGRIGRSSVTQGALVTANQAEPLATVQQLDPIYVDVTQSSSELLALRRQLAAGKLKDTDDWPVQVLLEDGSRYRHDGKLTFADVTVDPTTGSFALRVQVPNPENILMPGMYVRAVLSPGIREEALLVPQRGVTRDPKGNATAMVVAANGTVERRAVQVSRTVGDRWLVEGGLVAGDQVVVEGLQKIQPGVPVQATEASTRPAAGGSSPPAAGGSSASAPEPSSEPAAEPAAKR